MPKLYVVSLLALPVLPYTPYWILSTDYENSALVYSCTDVLRLFHVDFAWILGRTRSLPAATIDHGKEVFTNNNIDVSRMILSRQQGCDKGLWMTGKPCFQCWDVLCWINGGLQKYTIHFNKKYYSVYEHSYLIKWPWCLGLITLFLQVCKP